MSDSWIDRDEFDQLVSRFSRKGSKPASESPSDEETEPDDRPESAVAEPDPEVGAPLPEPEPEPEVPEAPMAAGGVFELDEDGVETDLVVEVPIEEAPSAPAQESIPEETHPEEEPPEPALELPHLPEPPEVPEPLEAGSPIAEADPETETKPVAPVVFLPDSPLSEPGATEVPVEGEPLAFEAAPSESAADEEAGYADEVPPIAGIPISSPLRGGLQESLLGGAATPVEEEEAEGQTEPEPVAEAEPELEPEPVLEVSEELEAEREPDPEPVAEDAPEPEPEPDPVSETSEGPEPETIPEPLAEETPHPDSSDEEEDSGEIIAHVSVEDSAGEGSPRAPEFFDPEIREPEERDSADAEGARALDALANARLVAERNRLLRARQGAVPPPAVPEPEIPAAEVPAPFADAKEEAATLPVSPFLDIQAESDEPEVFGDPVDASLPLRGRIDALLNDFRERSGARAVSLSDREGFVLHDDEGELFAREVDRLFEGHAWSETLPAQACQFRIEEQDWEGRIRGAAPCDHLVLTFRSGDPLEAFEVEQWGKRLADAIVPTESSG